jgi:hypothetical protein
METEEQPAFTGDPFNVSPALRAMLEAKILGKGDAADDAKLEAWAKAHRKTRGVKDEEEAAPEQE